MDKQPRSGQGYMQLLDGGDGGGELCACVVQTNEHVHPFKLFDVKISGLRVHDCTRMW